MKKPRKIVFERGYVAARGAEYPPVQDFADAYYWQQRGDPKPMEDYLARIDAIKGRYPKEKKYK